MDFQNRAGSKPGSAGIASSSLAAIHRRERLRKLAQETMDLSKDPYLHKNQLGSFECKLCLTLHANEGAYMSHVHGRKHQLNLERRKKQEQREREEAQPARPPEDLAASSAAVHPSRRHILRIGRPGYKVTKIRDPATRQLGLLFQIHFPQMSQQISLPKLGGGSSNSNSGGGEEHVDIVGKPMHRFMSAFEQKQELPPNRAYQYLLVAAEPYETVAFKIPSLDLDRQPGRFWTHWDPDTKVWSLQLLFRGV